MFAVFDYEYENCKYKPPRLWNYISVWKQQVFPLLKKTTTNPDIIRMIKENEISIEQGWKIGVEEKEDQTLNQDSYPEDWLGEEAEIETAIQLTEELMKGKCIPIAGGEKAQIPHFVVPKKINTTTGAVEKCRMIRDCTHSGPGQVSINDITPDKNAKVRMPLIKDIMRILFIMWLAYGFGCLLAKTDLKGAFRQLWLSYDQCAYCVYTFHGKKMMDMYDIWGSRSGSKHTQELGQLVCRYFMSKWNGMDRMIHVNNALDSPNINEWERKQKKMQKSPIYEWGYEEVNNWMIRNNLSDLTFLTICTITNGEQLLNVTKERIMSWSYSEKWKSEIINKYKLHEKVVLLKMNMKDRPIVLIDNYVDDYFCVMPPHQDIAQEMTESIGDCMESIGIEEEIKKRDGPKTEIEIIGLVWNTSNMTVTPSVEKKEKILNILYKIKLLKRTTIKQLESVIGKLTFCAVLMWPGKAFLRRLRDLLYKYVNKYGRKTVTVYLPDWALRDVNWWIDWMLKIPKVSIIRQCIPKSPNKTMEFDGATNGSREKGWRPGIGINFEGRMMWDEVPTKFLNSYINIERNYEKEYAIAHFEMLAIVVGLWSFRELLKTDDCILLRTDNKFVESVLKSKNSADLFLSDGVRWICMFAMEKEIRFYVTYINTKVNIVADALSRFDPKTATDEVVRRGRTPEIYRNIEYPEINKW